MSNNPFLRSKEQKSNNRFNFLDSTDDNNDKKPVKKQDKYDSSNNSFTKSSNNDSRFNNNNNRRTPNDSSRENTSFKSKVKEPIKSDEFSLSEELFPVLAPIVSLNKNSTNFKDALNYKNNIDIENNKLKPGWIEIYKDKNSNNIIMNEGAPTPYKIKKQQKENLKEEDPNSFMIKTINRFQSKWDNYRKLYNSIYGEDSYDDLYYLPQVYGAEYDDIEYDSLTEEEIDETIYSEIENIDDVYP